MTKHLITSLIMLSSVFVTQFSSASLYPFNPSSPMYIGGGFNPFKPNEGYLDCIDYDNTKSLDTPNNRELYITVSKVESRKDFYSKTDFSASVSASYGPFSGSGSVNKMDEVSFNENDFHWVVVMKSNMGRWGLVNPRLQPSLSSMSDDQLYRRCGSEIVTQQSKGVMIYALVTVHNMSQSERHEFESQIGAGFNNVVYGASVAAKFKSIVQFSYAVGSVSMLVDAFGGEGIKRFADIVGGSTDQSFANFEKLPDLINAYVKDFNPQNAVPLDYTTTSLAAFKPDLQVKYSDFKTAEVGAIYIRYIDTLKTIEKIDNILSPNYGSDESLTDSVRSGLESARSLYLDNQYALYDAGRKCFNPTQDNFCKLPKISDIKVVWPRGNINKICTQKRDDALGKNYYPYEFYQMAVKRNLIPILDINDNGSLSIVGYNKCLDEY